MSKKLIRINFPLNIGESIIWINFFAKKWSAKWSVIRNPSHFITNDPWSAIRIIFSTIRPTPGLTAERRQWRTPPFRCQGSYIRGRYCAKWASKYVHERFLTRWTFSPDPPLRRFHAKRNTFFLVACSARGRNANKPDTATTNDLGLDSNGIFRRRC